LLGVFVDVDDGVSVGVEDGVTVFVAVALLVDVAVAVFVGVDVFFSHSPYFSTLSSSQTSFVGDGVLVGGGRVLVGVGGFGVGVLVL